MDQKKTDKKQLQQISNQWVNSVFVGYGKLKQEIFLQVIEQIQQYIIQVMNGKKVHEFGLKLNEDALIEIDMARLVHYNNYFQVRKAVKEMSTYPINIYCDPNFSQNIYRKAILLNGFERHIDGKSKILVRIKKSIIELLLYVVYAPKKDTGKMVPKHYTKFDPDVIRNSSTKYMFPLYLLVSSYAGKGGFTMKLDDLRTRLQVEEKYKGYDNFKRFVLVHVQKELQFFGDWCFNFTEVKTGNKVTSIVFKIFANSQANKDNVWSKIQKALREDLPYFAKFSFEQREEFNYLLTGDFDLAQVLAKFHYIHKSIEKKIRSQEKIRSIFTYTYNSIKNEFPPPE